MEEEALLLDAEASLSGIMVKCKAFSIFTPKFSRPWFPESVR
jgi:hypothetical protein